MRTQSVSDGLCVSHIKLIQSPSLTLWVRNSNSLLYTRSNWHMMHTDPLMNKYESEDLTTCAKCGAFMLSLRDYDLKKSGEGPTVGGEWYEVILWGWWKPVANFAYVGITFKSRQRKLVQLQGEYASHPDSLVCPSCWHVKKR